MCGICGIIDFSGHLVHEKKIHSMMDAMRHRGPNDEGVYVSENIGLGFVRLSIIDLTSGGHQPMSSKDGRFTMVFNGEIYNYLELKKELEAEGVSFKSQSDSEVLLEAYIHWGETCLNKFNGMWAIAIYDKHQKSLFCARDRFGVKPFYYSLQNNQFVFASDIPPILKILPSKPSANNRVIYDYFVFNRTDQSPQTFFNEVSKIGHGHFMTINNSGSGIESNYTIKKWYNLESNLKEPFSSPGEYLNMFRSSIKLRLRSDVPVGVCLSGGLDSSSIVSVLSNDLKSNINTFSAIYGKGVRGDETNFIEEFNGKNLKMHFVTPECKSLLNDIPQFLNAHSEPVPTLSPYAQFKVMELAGKNVVVTLDGQGADEQLAGYLYFFGIYFKELLSNFKFASFFSESWNYLMKYKDPFGFLNMFYYQLSPNLKNNIKLSRVSTLSKSFTKKNKIESTIVHNLHSSDSLKRALLDHFEYKLEHLLKWSDRNSMWFSVEARVPFLDYRLVERTLSLDPEMIIHKGFTKLILREAMRDLLPERIRIRTDKVGFDTPSITWFRDSSMVEYIDNLITSHSFINRGVFDHKKVKLHFNDFNERKIESAGELWKWVNLENWYRKYID